MTVAHILTGLLARADGLLGRLPWSVAALALRVFPASVFFASGRTKVEGFAIADSTWFLFQHEYALPLIPSDWAAVMATLAGKVFSSSAFLSHSKSIQRRLSAVRCLRATGQSLVWMTKPCLRCK